MTPVEPTLGDYLRAAFVSRTRVPGLGGVPMNLLALLGVGVAGFFFPGIWLVGAGLEVGYLAWRTQSEKFRRIVRGRLLLASALTVDQRIEAIAARLGQASRARLARLRRICDVIRETGGALATMAEIKENGLQSLVLIHARLLLSRETLLAAMTEEAALALRQKITEGEAKLRTATSEAVRRSLEANLDILRRRQESHKEAKDDLAVIDAELERIENQTELIREEAAVSRDPEALSARIDAVANTLGEASRFLRSSDALTGMMGGLGPEEERLPLPGGVPPIAPRSRTKE